MRDLRKTMTSLAPRFLPAVLLALAASGCIEPLETTSTSDTTDVEDDEEREVYESTSELTISAAKTIARNYHVPQGPQGWGDSPAFSYTFDGPGDVDTIWEKRVSVLGGMGASIAGCDFSWNTVDVVDELKGQAPSAANCNSGYRKLTKLDPNGPDYCIDHGPLQRCENLLRAMTARNINATIIIKDTPRAYSYPACLAVMQADLGLNNSCIPTRNDVAQKGREHLRRFVRYLASRFSTTTKLTDFIAFNEVGNSNYFSIQGLPRPNGRSGTVDITSPGLTEGEMRLWGEEYADIMRTIHDGIADAGRTDVMLWTSFDNWFLDNFQGTHWRINNQYIIDALKAKLGVGIDWGISIHPYGNPSPYTFGPLTEGDNPQLYRMGNLDKLSKQMDNWLRSIGAATPDAFPQKKIFASEQGYTDLDLDTSERKLRPGAAGWPTPPLPYTRPFARDENRLGEWVCRAHDAVVRNPSVIAVTHRSFQQEPESQKAEQNGAPGDQWGLVSGSITGRWDADRGLQFPQVGQSIDLNMDLIEDDGIAVDDDGNGMVDHAVVNATGQRVPLPSNRTVLDSFAATFDEVLWKNSNSHACCSKFYLGCVTAPLAAKPTGTIDVQSFSVVNQYRIEGRACAPRANVPVMVEVRNGSTVVATAPANQSLDAGSSALPACQIAGYPSYPNQKYKIVFTRDQIAQNLGRSLQVWSVLPDTSQQIGSITMPSSLPASYNDIKGYVDQIVSDTNLFTLRGWACATGIPKSIPVDVYSSWPPDPAYFIKSATANFLTEDAVNGQCGDSKVSHRFEIYFTRAEALAHQGRTLHVYGISPVGGPNNVLAKAGDFKMPTVPASYGVSGSINGRVETLGNEAGRYVLSGWTCVHGDPRSLAVHVYTGDSWNSPACGANAPVGCLNFVKADIADISSEPSLNTLCGQGTAHRFRIPFTEQEIARNAGRRIAVFALHPSGQGPNPVLPRAQDFMMPINGDLPLVGDFDADGRQDDVAIWRPSNGMWYWRRSDQVLGQAQWGMAGDIPLVGDFDSDGQLDDLGIFRPTTGLWYAKRTDGSIITTTPIQWGGAPGDVPLVGDFDGDGRRDDLGIWRPSNATWHAKRREGTIIYTNLYWGLPGDIGMAGDFDRDGLFDDIMVFRPSDGTWYAGRSDASIIWYYYDETKVTTFGSSLDVPLLGDFNSGGVVDDFGIWRREAARADGSVGGKFLTKRWTGSGWNFSDLSSLEFGGSGDTPLIGDFDGDGALDDVAVYTPGNASQSQASWKAARLSGGASIFNFNWTP